MNTKEIKDYVLETYKDDKHIVGKIIIPVNINWETKSITVVTTDATWGLVDANQNCLPVLIACY